MEPSEFYTIVRQQADLESVEEAEDASKPVLRTLGERLSAGAVDDLTGFLPGRSPPSSRPTRSPSRSAPRSSSLASPSRRTSTSSSRDA